MSSLEDNESEEQSELTLRKRQLNQARRDKLAQLPELKRAKAACLAACARWTSARAAALAATSEDRPACQKGVEMTRDAYRKVQKVYHGLRLAHQVTLQTITKLREEVRFMHELGLE